MSDFWEFFNLYLMGGLQALIGFCFLARFLGRKVSFLPYTLSALLGTVLILILPLNGIPEFLVYVLLLLAGGIFLCRADFLSAALYALLTAEIMQLCFGVFNSLLTILFPLFFFAHSETAGILFMLIGNIMSLSVSVLCYLSADRILGNRRFLFDKPACLSHQSGYHLILLLPVLTICLIGMYINSVIYGAQSLPGLVPIPNKDAIHYLLLTVQLLGLGSLFCILYACRRLAEEFQLKLKLSLLEQEEHSLRQYLAEADARHKETVSFRHDIKNHLTLIGELLRKGESNRALSYLTEVAEFARTLSPSCHTGHPVVDTLLGNKLGIAESQGISVRCSVQLPSPCTIGDMDFCILLSNALDNALQACREIPEGAERYICLKGSVQGDFILLEIENSFREKSFTRKGTGLANISSIAEKYNGSMTVKAQNSVFSLSVLLIIP